MSTHQYTVQTNAYKYSLKDFPAKVKASHLLDPEGQPVQEPEPVKPCDMLMVTDDHQEMSLIVFERLPPLPMGHSTELRNQIAAWVAQKKYEDITKKYDQYRKDFREELERGELGRAWYPPFKEAMTKTIQTRQQLANHRLMGSSAKGDELLKKLQQLERYVLKKYDELWLLACPDMKDDPHDDRMRTAVMRLQTVLHFLVKHNISHYNNKPPRAPPCKCDICLEQCVPAELPCGHQFGEKCIKKWVREGNRSCPVCRASVRTTDIRPVYA